MTTENEVKPRRRTRPGAQHDALAGTAASDPGPDPAAAGSMSAVGSVQGETVGLSKSVVGGVRADSVTIEQGLAGGVLAGSVEVRQAIVRTTLAQRVEVGQSFVRSLLANEVHLRPSTYVGVLLARRVEGDVKVLIDWRGAAAFGAVAGLVAGLVRGARGRAR